MSYEGGNVFAGQLTIKGEEVITYNNWEQFEDTEVREFIDANFGEQEWDTSESEET